MVDLGKAGIACVVAIGVYMVAHLRFFSALDAVNRSGAFFPVLGVGLGPLSRPGVLMDLVAADGALAAGIGGSVGGLVFFVPAGALMPMAAAV